MALISCPECGKQISDKAATCPHCKTNIQKAIAKNQEEQRQPQKIAKSSTPLTICIITLIAVLAGIVLGWFLTRPKDNSNKPVRGAQLTKDITIQVGGLSFVMKPIQGGTFQMGSTDYEAESDECPVHTVTLGSYYICETEVTQALWESVMRTSVSQQRDRYMPKGPLRGVGANYPMYYINRYECQEFIQKLNNLTGKRFRLPTEAEWEYAARGGNQGSTYKYAGSSSLDNAAWYSYNSSESSHPVKSKSPNSLCLYDMSGNVWEWCNDGYDSNYYSYSPSNNPQCGGGQYSVVRGGSWYSQASFCRVSKRHKLKPEQRDSCYGFRLVMEP